MKRGDDEFDLKQAELEGLWGVYVEKSGTLLLSVTHRPGALDIQDPSLLNLNLYLARFPVLYKHVTIGEGLV